MLDKHLKSHSLSGHAESHISEQDLHAQKLFVGLCLCGSCLALLHVAHEIPPAKWTGIFGILVGLAYAVHQGWKLAFK
jgi:hypothetical protein